MKKWTIIDVHKSPTKQTRYTQTWSTWKRNKGKKLVPCTNIMCTFLIKF